MNARGRNNYDGVNEHDEAPVWCTRKQIMRPTLESMPDCCCNRSKRFVIEEIERVTEDNNTEVLLLTWEMVQKFHQHRNNSILKKLQLILPVCMYVCTHWHACP